MFDIRPLPSPSPSESSSSTSSPAHLPRGESSHSSQNESFHTSQDESPDSSQDESPYESQDESLHSSQYESSYSTTSPHLSIRSSIVGSVPNSSSSSTGPSPTRFPFPTHLPMHPELKPMRSCLPNAIPPGPMYLPRVRFISYLLASRPLPRPPRPNASTKEAESSQTPEVSVKGIISTPPRSITSSLSSLSPLSLTPPPSPPHTPSSRSALPSIPLPSTSLPSTSLPLTSLPLTSASLSRLSSRPTHWKSLPLLNASSSFPPILPSTSSLSQATMPQAPHESLKKSVSEPHFQN